MKQCKPNIMLFYKVFNINYFFGNTEKNYSAQDFVLMHNKTAYRYIGKQNVFYNSTTFF